MPSSFLNQRSTDGDGRRDLSTKPDVFASAANYLKKADGATTSPGDARCVSPATCGSRAWARQSFPNEDLAEAAGMQVAGVRNADGGTLPARPLKARLVMPDGVDGPAYLVYSNYESILRWNRSNYYALAIGHLSDSLR